MSKARNALGVVGVVATLFGVLLLVAPETIAVGPIVPLAETVATVDAAMLLLIGGIAAVLLILVTIWPHSESREQFAQDASTQETKRHPADHSMRSFEQAIRDGGDAFDAARRTLVATATHSYATVNDVSESAARNAVKRGEWTDDSLAAGVLSETTPLSARLRLWIAPARERRKRLERTIDAIESLYQ